MTSSFILFCLLVCIGTSSVWGLQVTPNSPCARLCMDDTTADVSDPNVSNTNGSDIVCNDADYSSTVVGRKFKQCLSCLQNSTASSGSESDQGWFFYNLRYAFDSCIFAATNVSDPISTPCSTDSVCAPLQSALQTGMQDLSTMGGNYSYCTANNNAFVGSHLGICQSCLRENSDVFYLSNFLVALDAGCIQEPPPGTVVGLNTTLFSDTQVAIIAPVTTQASAPKPHKALSTGAIIGIVVGGVVLLIIIAAVTFIYTRKRRNAKRLQKLRSPLDERFGAGNITAPNKGAYSSPQASPSLHKDDIQMKQAPAVRNFSFSRPIPQRAGEWTGISPPGTSSTGAFSQAGSPPGYSASPQSFNEGRNSIPAHHAYIPPDYTNPSSPTYVSPPPPPQSMPQSYPQRSPSTSISSGGTTTNTSPGYIHRSSPSVASVRSRTTTPAPVSVSPGTRLVTNRHPSISPSLINQMPNPSPNFASSGNPNPSPNPSNPFNIPVNNRSPGWVGNNNGNSNGNGGEVEISGPITRQVGSRFESEEEARRARERLYREGLAGRTLAHGKEEESEPIRGSPDSESSEELWPGSY